MTPAGRTWGDGGGDARPHVIETISYANDIIGCRCGTALRGIIDGKAWRNHGGKVLGLITEMGERPDLHPRRNADAALAGIVAVAEGCTCATTSIEDCPNYVEGDEVTSDERE